MHPPDVETWCLTACSFELLDDDEQRRYRVAPFIDQVLAHPTHPRYMGGYVQLGTPYATDDFRFAEAALRSGATVTSAQRCRARPSTWW